MVKKKPKTEKSSGSFYPFKMNNKEQLENNPDSKKVPKKRRNKPGIFSKAVEYNVYKGN